MHFFGARTGQVRRDNSRRVRTHEKIPGEIVSQLGTIIQSFFCAQSGAGIRMNFWKWSGESRYPGALMPVLENFSRPEWLPLGLRKETSRNFLVTRFMGKMSYLLLLTFFQLVHFHLFATNSCLSFALALCRSFSRCASLACRPLYFFLYIPNLWTWQLI